MLTIQRVRDMHIGSGGKEAQLEVFELNRIMMVCIMLVNFVLLSIYTDMLSGSGRSLDCF